MHKKDYERLVAERLPPRLPIRREIPRRCTSTPERARCHSRQQFPAPHGPVDTLACKRVRKARGIARECPAITLRASHPPGDGTNPTHRRYPLGVAQPCSYGREHPQRLLEHGFRTAHSPPVAAHVEGHADAREAVRQGCHAAVPPPLHVHLAVSLGRSLDALVVAHEPEATGPEHLRASAHFPSHHRVQPVRANDKARPYRHPCPVRSRHLHASHHVTVTQQAPHTPTLAHLHTTPACVAEQEGVEPFARHRERVPRTAARLGVLDTDLAAFRRKHIHAVQAHRPLRLVLGPNAETVERVNERGAGVLRACLLTRKASLVEKQHVVAVARQQSGSGGARWPASYNYDLSLFQVATVLPSLLPAPGGIQGGSGRAPPPDPPRARAAASPPGYMTEAPRADRRGVSSGRV